MSRTHVVTPLSIEMLCQFQRTGRKHGLVDSSNPQQSWSGCTYPGSGSSRRLWNRRNYCLHRPSQVVAAARKRDDGSTCELSDRKVLEVEPRTVLVVPAKAEEVLPEAAVVVTAVVAQPVVDREELDLAEGHRVALEKMVGSGGRWKCKWRWVGPGGGGKDCKCRRPIARISDGANWHVEQAVASQEYSSDRADLCSHLCCQCRARLPEISVWAELENNWERSSSANDGAAVFIWIYDFGGPWTFAHQSNGTYQSPLGQV